MVSVRLLRVLHLPRPILCLRQLSSLPDATQELLNLGFSEEQTERILSLKPRGAEHQRRLSSAKELLLIGLDPSTTLKMLERSPELRKVTSKELRDRTDMLRSLGLGEGSLQRSVSSCPDLLSLPRYRILAAAQCLKQHCKFSSQQVTQILRSSPEALTQDPQYLEEIFQYVYFRMGGTQQEMISSGLFRTSLNEIRVRHQFLERLGRFHPPSKKRIMPLANPKIKEVIVLSEQDFLSRVAQASHEELQTFRKIIEREESEAPNEDDGNNTSSDSDNEEEESDTDSDGEGEDSEDEGGSAGVQNHTTHPHKKRT
ncbi:transcription termination factor 4, mitochondrial [Discoglossus pictus]